MKIHIANHFTCHFSAACYMAIVLFVQQVPLIGMLKIPKTMTNIAVCLLFYNELYKTSPVSR